MAKRRRGRARPESTDGDFEQPVDPVVIGQGVGNFETINGMPNGIIAAVLVVITVILIRPIMRAMRAFIRQ
jgi:hypothetical protein